MSDYMKLALQQAHLAYERQEIPVGAVIVYKDKDIIIPTYNMVYSNCDPTAHAEIIAIRKMSMHLQSLYLNECDLYVTLEPCVMCAQAISYARIRRLYFGAYNEKGGGIYNGAKFFSNKACFHKPEIYCGIMAKSSALLLQNFFNLLR